MANRRPRRAFVSADHAHAHSLEQAIKDGVLVDVSPVAAQVGFKVPVAVTRSVWARLEPSERDAQLGQSIQGRLWDVLMVLRAHAATTDADTISFNVIVSEGGEQYTLHLKAVIHTPDPVVMIMFEHED